MTDTPVIDITPRDIDFDLDPAHINDWLDGSREKTAFWNALSMLFPVGERFFVSTVNQHRSFATDPKLKAEVKAFVQQEGMHTREHLSYNKALASVIDVDRIEKRFEKHVALLRKLFGELRSLMATTAFEHYTAILAEAALDHPEYLAGAREDYGRVWTWHALEELEHKAVAFDVMMRASAGKPGIKKVVAMAIVTEEFIRYVTYRVWLLFKAQNLHRNPLSWAKLAWYLFGSPGLVRRLAPTYLRYYAPAFHPDDIDNAATLARTREVVAAYA